MPAVSNTSPICNLAVIGRLAVLHARFGVVVIPQAVRDELDRLEHAGGRRAILDAYADGWLRVAEVSRRELVDVLALSLDAGESEAIALARELKAGILVMDHGARGLSLWMWSLWMVTFCEKDPSSPRCRGECMNLGKLFLAGWLANQFEKWNKFCFKWRICSDLNP